MRTYEVLVIVRPEVPEAEMDALLEPLQHGVEHAGGKVTKLEKWGKRPLAYQVAGRREGFYVLLEIEGAGEALRELERRMKVTEPVMKYISVRVDLERKKLEKLRHRREHRAARRQRPAAGAGTAEAPASA